MFWSSLTLYLTTVSDTVHLFLSVLIPIVLPCCVLRPEFTAPTVNFGNVHPSDVLDMPVDPNEPTYCLCHQVSYGEMIGCDNTDVSPQLSAIGYLAVHEH